MKYIIILLGILIFFSFGFMRGPQKNGLTDFWSMKGNLVTHIYIEQKDSLSGPELFEMQNENGLPVWFGRHIFKDVCITGECKMIHIWIFWDGAGNYLGFQLYEEQIPEPCTLLQTYYSYPLTKSDHTEFEPADYEKLNDILRDTASILKTLKQEDLIIVSDSIDPYEVDGYTAATQPTLIDVVVKDAVYTCYTLWHTVYGPVQNEILRILENRISKEFLTKMFESNKPEYISWAIESVEKHPEHHKTFYSKILQIIKSENSVLANQALDYFRPELLTDTAIQQQLIQVMTGLDTYQKNQIIWRFINLGNAESQVVLGLLNLFSDNILGVESYNLILRLVTPEHLKENEQIIHILNDLSENENGYVRNLTKRALNEKNQSISQ